MSKATAKLIAPDISCMHCAKAIADGLNPVEGIDEVSVDVPTKTVTVGYNDDVVTEDIVKAILSDLGYPVAG